MIRLVLAVLLVLLVVGYFLGRWIRRTPAPQVARTLRRLMWFGGGAFLVLMAVTGKLHWIFGVLGGLIPVFQRVLFVWRQAQRLRGYMGRVRSAGPGRRAGGAAGRTSTVETSHLRMSLDHGQGRLDGMVLQGPHRGRRLSELDEEALVALLHTLRIEDGEGARLLEAYLDRRFGAAWRQREHRRHGNSARDDGRMTVEEAREILGVGPDATPEEIRRAHRRLMQKYHPDRGGSTALAAKINRAKAVLLGKE